MAQDTYLAYIRPSLDIVELKSGFIFKSINLKQGDENKNQQSEYEVIQQRHL